MWVKECIVFQSISPVLPIHSFLTHSQNKNSYCFTLWPMMSLEQLKFIQCFCLIECHSPAQESELYFQMANSPLSLQVASSPASFGFQDTQLMSWLWALGTWADMKKTGCSGSAVRSSLNTRTPSSPHAVARAPVRRHLNMSKLRKITCIAPELWSNDRVSAGT